MSDEKFEPVYLGDGAYAKFDGYMIGISVGGHTHEPVVWFEPEVFWALLQYANRFWNIPGQESKQIETGPNDNTGI